MSSDSDTPKNFEDDRLIHPKAGTTAPEKIAQPDFTSPEEFNQQMQKDLVGKAYALFGWTLFLFFVVFIVGIVRGEENNALITETYRVLTGILTFLLGFLFATIRR